MMGQPEIKFQIVRKKDWLGRLRFNLRIVDTENGKIILASNQGYSRLIDANKAIGLVQRYAAIADVEEAEK